VWWVLLAPLLWGWLLLWELLGCAYLGPLLPTGGSGHVVRKKKD